MIAVGNIILALVVVGVALWLLNFLPMDGTIKAIVKGLAIILVVFWCLGALGLLPSGAFRLR